MRVPLERAEEARAAMLDLCPEGFEEVERRRELELAAYVDPVRDEAFRRVFGHVETHPLAAGWEEAWRSFHRPVRVGRLWIGPPWEPADAATLAVIIDPGRAFGTGGHPSTILALELLLAQRPTSVADLGCGSGVLAIAAAKLAFRPVAALDKDEVAVEAARRNALANDAEVAVTLADVLVDPLPEVGLALANLERALVEALAPRLRARALIASGYPVSERPALRGWKGLERRALNGWAADLFERT